MTNREWKRSLLVILSVVAMAGVATPASATYWWHLGRSSPHAEYMDTCKEPDGEYFVSPAATYEFIRNNPWLGKNPVISDTPDDPDQVHLDYTDSSGERRRMVFFRTWAACEATAKVFQSVNRGAAIELDRYR